MQDFDSNSVTLRGMSMSAVTTIFSFLLLLVVVMYGDAVVTSSTLCDSTICTCPSTFWGNVTCQCAGTQQEVIIRASGSQKVPSHLTVLYVLDCEHVLLTDGVFHNLTYLQKIELKGIKKLDVEARAFSRPLESEGGIRSTVEVLIEDSYVPDLPSYAFRGYQQRIQFHNVRVDTIAPFAFASLSALEHLEFRDCHLNNINAQAFKKFSMDKLLLIRTWITSSLPSRAMTDLEVSSELRLERVTALRLHSSSLLIRGPHSVHITACNISHIDGEALRISTQGTVVIQDNNFPSLDPGAFIGFSVERHTLREKGKQELVFYNNTLHSFKEGALNFNHSAFEAQVEKVLLSRLCACDILEYWLSNLKVTASELSCLDSLTNQLIEVTHAGCMPSYIWNGTVVLIITISVGLLVLAIALLVLCLWRRRQRTRGKRWVTVPNKHANKNKPKNPGNVQAMGMVLPDGRTYRETELHVIVERAEPLEDKEQ